MSIFNNLKETISEEINNTINSFKPKNRIKCPICDRNMIYETSKCCNECRQKILADTKLMADYIARLEYDISKGYKKLEPYLSRYELIIETHRKMRVNKKYIENYIEIMKPETMDEVKKIYYKRIKDMIEEKKSVLIYQFETTGEMKFFNQLKKLRDEILEMQIKYPQFKDCLEHEDIQHYISHYK